MSSALQHLQLDEIDAGGVVTLSMARPREEDLYGAGSDRRNEVRIEAVRLRVVKK